MLTGEELDEHYEMKKCRIRGLGKSDHFGKKMKIILYWEITGTTAQRRTAVT